MNNNNQIKGNKLINTANNKDNKNIFNSIIYKNSNEINYEEYYIYNNKDNLYFVNCVQILKEQLLNLLQKDI